MSVGDTYRVLADLLDRLESWGIEIRNVCPMTAAEAGDEDELSVHLELRLPAQADVATLESDDAPVRSFTDGGSPVAIASLPLNGASHTNVRNVGTAISSVLPSLGLSGGVTTGNGVNAHESVDTAIQPAARERTCEADVAEAEVDGQSATGEETLGADGDTATIPCRDDACSATFENEHGMNIHYSKVHADEDGDGPIYTDPEALRAVYDRCETFEEMTRELGVSVTPATVRRHMIEHGIHQPRTTVSSDSKDTSKSTEGVKTSNVATTDEADASPPEGRSAGVASPLESEEVATDARQMEEPEEADGDGKTAVSKPADDDEADHTADPCSAVDSIEMTPDGHEKSISLPDDVDLPSGITLEDVVEAVQTSRTLFEVGRDLRMSREQARALLSDLKLLDFVTGRLSTQEDRTARNTEILERLESRATGDDS